MRVADIDMTRLNINCPQGFTKITTAGKRICGSQSSRCISTTFSSHGIEYSRVCGRINGYQFSYTNGFASYITRRGSIDSTFVDEHMATHVTTFGPLQVAKISTEVIQMPVLAIVTPTVTLYHHMLEMTTSVTVDIAITLILHRPT